VKKKIQPREEGVSLGSHPRNKEKGEEGKAGKDHAVPAFKALRLHAHGVSKKMQTAAGRSKTVSGARRKKDRNQTASGEGFYQDRKEKPDRKGACHFTWNELGSSRLWRPLQKGLLLIGSRKSSERKKRTCRRREEKRLVGRLEGVLAEKRAIKRENQRRRVGAKTAHRSRGKKKKGGLGGIEWPLAKTTASS